MGWLSRLNWLINDPGGLENCLAGHHQEQLLLMVTGQTIFTLSQPYCFQPPPRARYTFTVALSCCMRVSIRSNFDSRASR